MPCCCRLAATIRVRSLPVLYRFDTDPGQHMTGVVRYGVINLEFSMTQLADFLPTALRTARTAPGRTAVRGLGSVVVLAGAAILSGCVVPPVDGGGYGNSGYYESSTMVYNTYGSPPPPRVEYRTVAPGADYVWMGGDWEWGGRRYDWRPGRWEAPRYGSNWREPSRRDRDLRERDLRDRERSRDRDRDVRPPRQVVEQPRPPRVDRNNRPDDRPRADDRRPTFRPAPLNNSDARKDAIIDRQRGVQQWGGD